MHQSNAKRNAAHKSENPTKQLYYAQLIQNKSNSRGFLTWIKTGRKSLAMWQLCWMMRACLSCCECFLKLASAFSLLHPLSRTCLQQAFSSHLFSFAVRKKGPELIIKNLLQNLYLISLDVGILTPQRLNKSLPWLENAEEVPVPPLKTAMEQTMNLQTTMNRRNTKNPVSDM